MHAIRAMPTFVVLKNGEELGRVQGADANGLNNLIAQHYQPVERTPEKPNPRKANEQERKWLHEYIVSRVDQVGTRCEAVQRSRWPNTRTRSRRCWPCP